MFAVTIDGKAGCGKSTLADELSKQLNLKKFNTGAVYRGITCEYKKNYGEMEPEISQIENFVKNLNVEVVFDSARSSRPSRGRRWACRRSGREARGRAGRQVRTEPSRRLSC